MYLLSYEVVGLEGVTDTGSSQYDGEGQIETSTATSKNTPQFTVQLNSYKPYGQTEYMYT